MGLAVGYYCDLGYVRLQGKITFLGHMGLQIKGLVYQRCLIFKL